MYPLRSIVSAHSNDYIYVHITITVPAGCVKVNRKRVGHDVNVASGWEPMLIYRVVSHVYDSKCDTRTGGALGVHNI